MFLDGDVSYVNKFGWSNKLQKKLSIPKNKKNLTEKVKYPNVFQIFTFEITGISMNKPIQIFSCSHLI